MESVNGCIPLRLQRMKHTNRESTMGVLEIQQTINRGDVVLDNTQRQQEGQGQRCGPRLQT
jgi:hypothetical protein